MIRITIDNRPVDVPEGITLLEAARGLRIDVPALCHLDGCTPQTTCMVCVMRVRRRDDRAQRTGDLAAQFAPSCATRVEDGMVIESETPEVHGVRKAALELLLSDHAGECRAPCQYACPFDTDIPRMIRMIAEERMADAVAILRDAMPLSALLARLGPEACEGACRRCTVDEPAAIGLLKRHVADKSLLAGAPPPDSPTPRTGTRVAIVGAGPAGLSAASFLQRGGHACTVFYRQLEPGGSLRALIDRVAEPSLPAPVFLAEIRVLEQMGVRFVARTTVGADVTLDELRTGYDVVLLATGELDAGGAEQLGLPAHNGTLSIDRQTHETELPGVFAAGALLRTRGQALRAAVSGKSAAACVDQFLRGEAVRGQRKLTALRLPRPKADEITDLAAGASAAPRQAPARGDRGGLSEEQARAEARRCLHCDCHKLHECRLRKYAEMYQADASRYRGARRRFERRNEHDDVVFEPGKCILCGLCVQITQRAGEPLGLTLTRRGFETRIAVPFDRPLREALTHSAAEVVSACPTGAFAWRHEPPNEPRPGSSPSQPPAGSKQ